MPLSCLFVQLVGHWLEPRQEARLLITATSSNVLLPVLYVLDDLRELRRQDRGDAAIRKRRDLYNEVRATLAEIRTQEQQRARNPAQVRVWWPRQKVWSIPSTVDATAFAALWEYDCDAFAAEAITDRILADDEADFSDDEGQEEFPSRPPGVFFAASRPAPLYYCTTTGSFVEQPRNSLGSF